MTTAMETTTATAPKVDKNLSQDIAKLKEELARLEKELAEKRELRAKIEKEKADVNPNADTNAKNQTTEDILANLNF
jgi:predicted  nucleic acid-binding Zn-ribbon protein